MVQRHRFINAIRYPDPQEVYRPPLERPLTLKDVLARHPEWRRRLDLTLRAKRAGIDPPEFPPLHYCTRCETEFSPRTRPPFYMLCSACRPIWKRAL